MAARSMGVEEELLLVEPGTGVPLAVAESVLNGGEPAQTLDDRETLAGKETPEGNRRPEAGAGEESLEFELQQQQLETNSKPCDDLGELSEQVRRGRSLAAAAAARSGARIAALATSPIPVEPELVRKGRYAETGRPSSAGPSSTAAFPT